MRRTAFTLFELMVVITIIALLVSMLLPVIGMVRETARQIACASIMRQLGMVDASYFYFVGFHPSPITRLMRNPRSLRCYQHNRC